MLQLAVCITVHVAVEWRWEEPLLAYTLAGAEIELHLYFLVVLPSCFVISHFMNARDHFLCSYKQDSVFLSQLVMKALYNVQPCGAMILLTMNAGGTLETEIDSSSHTSHVE